MAQLLVTGGAGFIGSHTCLTLLKAGHQLVVLDSFANSSPTALYRASELAGTGAFSRMRIVEGDVRHSADLNRAFHACGSNIEAVVHFAGLKALRDSILQPLQYWDVNLVGSLRLLEVMRSFDCRTIIFSSSATLYGLPRVVPIPETAPICPVSPYGQTKAAVEQLLADITASEHGWRIASLRYFNPVGAHPSGHLGEDPYGKPNNLFPCICQVAAGRRAELEVFGTDWPTPDGTGVRDYIHVLDLAEGHSRTLDLLMRGDFQLLVLNLGSGRGHSVLELIHAFEVASGKSVPYRLLPRRPGDVAATVADPSKANMLLHWHARRGLGEICRDGWAWQQANPEGYPC